MTSVECERVFSDVKLIFTKLWSQLKITKLNVLMVLSRNGPEIEDFNEGIFNQFKFSYSPSIEDTFGL